MLMKIGCNKKTCAKTLCWRLIASGTTFTIAYMVDGTLKNASTIVVLDTAIKTLFYFLHERAWENQKTCFQPDIIPEAEVVNNSEGSPSLVNTPESDQIEI